MPGIFLTNYEPVILKHMSAILSLITMTVEDRLADFLRDARDWERRATNILGVFLLKLPEKDWQL